MRDASAPQAADADRYADPEDWRGALERLKREAEEGTGYTPEALIHGWMVTLTYGGGVAGAGWLFRAQRWPKDRAKADADAYWISALISALSDLLPRPFALLDGDWSSPSLHATWGSTPQYVEKTRSALVAGSAGDTKAHAPITLYAFLFNPKRDEHLYIGSVKLDAEEHVEDFSLARERDTARTIFWLRRVYIERGENAVRTRLGLPTLPLQLFTNGEEVYVAASAGDADAAQAVRHRRATSYVVRGWRPIAHGDAVTIREESLERRGDFAETTKTAAEWIRGRGRGFLCLTKE